ncbi:hypothetical protein T05_4908 [Trichinella murrelli]|uniref:Uncharacterized protein n=1 Tax=Trichinella murrelli TaxID=144512 RepID=A0A0V0T2T9_9BILA|nr:hypothetical protein T05_4908 [Trichinella murrelli]
MEKKLKVKFFDCYQGRFSENSLHIEAALTAILLGAVHRFLSAFKAYCSLKIFPDSNQRILLLTSEMYHYDVI